MDETKTGEAEMGAAETGAAELDKAGQAEWAAQQEQEFGQTTGPWPTDVKVMTPDEERLAEQLDFEELVDGVWRLVNNQPEHRELLADALSFCEEQKAEPDVEAYIQAQPEYAFETQSPFYLIDSLVRARGLDRLELDEEGEVVTPERKQGLDEDEVDDLIASIAYQTTAAGMAVAQDMRPQERLARLMEKRPRRRDAYRDVLELCLTPRSRVEIEKLLAGREVLVDEAVDGEPLKPSVFIDNLERSGVLVWDGAWNTTAAGKAFLEGSAG